MFPETILAHASEGIGNNLNFSPVVAALRELYPEAEITVLTKHPRMWEGLEQVDKTEKIGSPPSGRRSYDLIVSSFFNYEQERAGYQANRVVVPNQIVRGTLHEVEHNMLPIFQLDEFDYRGSIPPRMVAVPENGESLEGEGLLIGIVPGGLTSWQWGRKRWPYFKSLIRLLLDGGDSSMFGLDVLDPDTFPEVRALIVGAQHEKAEWSDYKPDDERVINRVGDYELPETIYALNQCDVVIGNDCGPAHVASVLGKRTYMIFGPTSTIKNRPREPNSQVLMKGIWCSPCQYTPQWEQCNRFECMSKFTPEEVLAQVSNSWVMGTDPFKTELLNE